MRPGGESSPHMFLWCRRSADHHTHVSMRREPTIIRDCGWVQPLLLSAPGVLGGTADARQDAMPICAAGGGLGQSWERAGRRVWPLAASEGTAIGRRVLLSGRTRSHGLATPLLGCDVDQRLVEHPLVPERVIESGLPLAVVPVVSAGRP